MIFVPTRPGCCPHWDSVTDGPGGMELGVIPDGVWQCGMYFSITTQQTVFLPATLGLCGVSFFLLSSFSTHFTAGSLIVGGVCFSFV